MAEELSGERSARIVQELDTQAEVDTALAVRSFDRHFKDEYPVAEVSAHKIGYRYTLEDMRAERI